MKKYIVLKPITTTNDKLLIDEDIIYIDELLKINSCGNKYTERKVYSSTTRQYLGNLLNVDNLKLEEN